MKQLMTLVLMGVMAVGLSACGQKQSALAPAVPATVSADGKTQAAIIYADTVYKPSHISAKAGVPLMLTFKHPENIAHCIQVLSIPEMNLKKDLTLAPETVIEIPPHQAGSLAFQCGMGMRKGQIDFE
ncbi:MAG: cupredoxin domain-containing protein [Candidatus Melainabacteria bacterium]